MATPRPARRSIATTVLLLAAVVAAFLTGVVSSPTAEAATPGFCSLGGMQKNTWTGGAGDGLWDTGANWSLGRAPNFTDGATGYACINAKSTVTMRAGESAELQAFDVATGTTLKLDTGSILLVEGSQVTRPSYLRSGTTTLLKGALGGPGRIELLGKMTWASSTTGASTMSTRRCGLGATCGGAVSGPRGLLVVGNAGLVEVTPLGVNLADEYQLRVYGTLKLLGQGYVSADRGTSLELLPKLNAAGVGTLLITNDGGWYEGRTLYGVTTLSAIANGGLIRKSAGTGTSVVVGTYSRVGSGAIRVDRGTLQHRHLRVPAGGRRTGPSDRQHQSAFDRRQRREHRARLGRGRSSRNHRPAGLCGRLGVASHPDQPRRAAAAVRHLRARRQDLVAAQRRPRAWAHDDVRHGPRLPGQRHSTVGQSRVRRPTGPGNQQSHALRR